MTAYLLVARTEQRSIAGDTNTVDCHVVLWDELVSANALTEIPDANSARAVATDELSLIRMDDHVVDGRLVDVVSLDAPGTSVPDLDSSVLGTRHHPLALTMEGNPGDIVGVTLEGHHRVGVGRLNVVKLDIGMSGRGQVPLVRSDAQPIHLGIGVLDRARANARERLPEAAFDTSVSTTLRWEAWFWITYRMVWSYPAANCEDACQLKTSKRALQALQAVWGSETRTSTENDTHVAVERDLGFVLSLASGTKQVSWRWAGETVPWRGPRSRMRHWRSETQAGRPWFAGAARDGGGEPGGERVVVRREGGEGGARRLGNLNPSAGSDGGSAA